MSAINTAAEAEYQLSPELEEKKANVERLGYIVRHYSHRGWTVFTPKGVRFLKLRLSEKPAYIESNGNSFESYEAWQSFWENLPEDQKYCWDNPFGSKKYFRIDPDAKAEWDRFSRASENLFDVLFNTPESLNAYEGDDDKEEFENFNEYLSEVIEGRMNVVTYRCDDGLGGIGSHDCVYAVRWDGDFPKLKLNGVEIVSTGAIELEEFRHYAAPVNELHEYDAKRLSLRLMPRNHPDLILSSSEGLRGDTEVRWVLPGLLEYQGMTLTYASPKRGKTALVMSELWRACQTGLCNIIYLAFEGHNGLGARAAALEERFGSCPTFAVKKAHWNLSDTAQWEGVRDFISEMKQSLAAMQDAPAVVVFDTVGSALGTGSRISGAPETFLGEVKRLQQEAGVALWLVSHQNDQGELYGFKGFTFDADVVTRIVRKSNGRDHVHSRLLGRHVESRKQLSTFRLVPVGSAFVAECIEDEVVSDDSKSDVVPGLKSAYRHLVPLLDEAGAADGLSEDELRDVLNSQYLKPNVKADAVRQRRNRAKSALLEAGVLENKDGTYYLVA